MNETASPALNEAAPPAPPPPTPIEPLMGIQSFAQTAALKPHMVVALRHWMARIAHQDPNQYYPHRAWQGFLADARNHPVG